MIASKFVLKEEVNKGDFWGGKVKEDGGVNVGPKCNFDTTKNITYVYNREGTKMYIFWGMNYVFF